MKYTLRFGTYWGIPVRIHFTFPLILVIFGAEAGLRGGPGEALWVVSLVLAVFVCVVLHEFGHSLQVRRYGIEVRDIVLLPIGGMARAERIPEDPRQEIIVAVSGPLVNFALALLLSGIAWVRRAPLDFENDFLLSLLSINLVLGTFNLIPAFPMDGGRILRGLLAMRMPYLKATRLAKNVGQTIAILFVLLGFQFPNLMMLPLIAVFIYFGATSEEKMVRVRVSLDGKTVRDFIPANPVMLSNESTLGSVAPQIELARAEFLPVTDRTGALAAAVDTEALRGEIRQGRFDERLDRFLVADIPLVGAGTTATQAYYFLKGNKIPFAGVIDEGHFKGLVFLGDLAGAVA